MGTDTPIRAVDKPSCFYTYFKQNFAQVTNPPIDPIREEIGDVAGVVDRPASNLLDCKHGEQQRLEVRQPILSQRGSAERSATSSDIGTTSSFTDLDITYLSRKGRGHEAALSGCAARPEQRSCGDNIIILSDRKVQRRPRADSRTAGTGAVHHHLIRKGLRTSVGLVVEPADRAKSTICDACRVRRRGDQPLSGV